MELEPSANTPLVVDKLPHVPEPPPVRLVAVEDVSLDAPRGVERELDDLYVRVLRFEREPGPGGPVYRAENVRLRFQVHEAMPGRSTLRPLQIEVPSLADLEARLAEGRLEYERMRGLTPGSESLLFRDPAGNLLEVSQTRPLL